jgi:hypothetical protein
MESKSLTDSLFTDLAPSICTSTGVIHSPHSVAPPLKCENLENNQGIHCNSVSCIMLFSFAVCCIALGVTVLACFIIIALCWKHKGTPSKLIV